jgi:hypothetical protein
MNDVALGKSISTQIARIRAYLRGTWLKTKKYQTVILAYCTSSTYTYANCRTLPVLGPVV